MRLTCPNCGAIYEVPDNVIPEDGRDVQCSNCAVTWFQHPAGWEEPEHDLQDDEAANTSEEALQATGTEPLPQDPAPEEEPEPLPAQEDPQPQDAPDEAPLPADPVPEDTPQEAPSATAALEPDDAADAEDLEPEELLARLEAAEAASAEAPAEEAPSTPPVATAAAATPTRRELDPAIRDLLREEAEYESQMRAKDKQADPIETQPDLGLTDPPRRRVIRVERHKIEDQDTSEVQPEAAELNEETTPEKPSNSRRDLLPDIEDINSTLRGRDRLQGPTTVGELMDDPEETRSGFRSGFFLTVLFALVLGAVYLQSTPLSKAMPAVAPTLQNYVENVDQARGWLDTRARGVVTWLDRFSSEAAETKE